MLKLRGQCRMHNVMLLFVFDYNSFNYLHFKLKPDLNNFKIHASAEFEISNCLDLKCHLITNQLGVLKRVAKNEQYIKKPFKTGN